MIILRYKSLRNFFIILSIIAIILISTQMRPNAQNVRKQNMDKIELSTTRFLLNLGMPMIQSYLETNGYDVSWDYLDHIKINFKPELILMSQISLMNNFRMIDTPKITGSSDIKTSTPKSVQTKQPDNIINESQQTINVPPATKTDTSHPQVLIYHTHTHESFIATSKYPYIPSDDDRSSDDNVNVVRLGNELKNILNSKGISTIDDSTVHDSPYDGAYDRSIVTLKKDIQKYPSIKFAFDLHRDGYGSIMKKGVKMFPNVNALPVPQFRKSYVQTKNGVNYARITFIIGSLRDKSSKEDWHNNYNFAVALSKRINELFPGLSLGVEVKDYSDYNQEVLNNSCLLEIGSNYNTLEETLASMPYIGQAFYDVMSKMK